MKEGYTRLGSKEQGMQRDGDLLSTVTQAAREALDAVSKAVLVLDHRWVVVFANVEAAAMFRTTSRALHGVPFLQLVPASVRGRQASQQAAFLTQVTAEPVCFDVVALRGPGEEFPVRMSLRTVGNEEPQHALVIATLREEAAPMDAADEDDVAAPLQAYSGGDSRLVGTQNVGVTLDRAGKITFVNDAWRRAAAERRATPATIDGRGLDYLAICERANEPVARLVAQGIRDVLSRKKRSFSQVYGCHSDRKQSWYRVEVRTPDENRPGAVVYHVFYH